MSERRFVFGVALTALWLLASAMLLFLKRGDLAAMTPNSWGDFLAGTFAPLAFLWLVLGYLQQGEELRLSTEALRLQAEELRNSVEQQRALVEVSRQQVEAEREAMVAERSARKESARPVIAVESDGGAFRGDGHSTYPLVLSNSGAIATRFHARLKYRQGSIQSLFRTLAFDRGHTHATRVEVDRPDQIEGALLELRFSDALGNEYIEEYVVSRQRADPHSNLQLYRTDV